VGIVSLCEIKHNEGPETRLFHEKTTKNRTLVSRNVSVKQNKRQFSANHTQNPGLAPVINETLGTYSQPAYTIPKSFYLPLIGMSSTNAQICRICTANFVDKNKIAGPAAKGVFFLR
jgi:hypothetical protein